MRAAVSFALLATLAGCSGGAPFARESAGDASTGGTTETTGLVFGSGDGSGGTSSTGADTVGATPTPDDACPTAHSCVSAAPAGWAGPVVLMEALADADLSACPAAYPTNVGEGGENLDAAPAACECECGTPVGASCQQTAQLRSHTASDDTCDDHYLVQQPLIGGVCTQLDFAGANSINVTLAPTPVTGGTCEAQTRIDTQEPAFGTEAMLCATSTLEAFGCDAGDVCAPDPEGAPLCVWQDGEHDCPAAYPNKRVLYDGWQDTRDCTECACGDPKGVCEGAIAYLYPPPTGNNPVPCGNTPLSVASANLCTGPSGALPYAMFFPSTGDVQAFCEVSEGGEPTGSVEPTGAKTVCCDVE